MKPPTFHPIPPDQLPRDDALQTGKDLTFRTLEHDQFDAPHAIEVTDKEGRSAVYVLLEVDGVVGRWKSAGEWAIFETEDLASVSEPRSGKSMSGKDAPGSPAKG